MSFEADDDRDRGQDLLEQMVPQPCVIYRQHNDIRLLLASLSAAKLVVHKKIEGRRSSSSIINEA